LVAAAGRNGAKFLGCRQSVRARRRLQHDDEPMTAQDPPLAELFQAHRQGLAGAVRGVLGRDAEVAEVLQDAFLKCWHGLQRGDLPRDPVAGSAPRGLGGASYKMTTTIQPSKHAASRASTWLWIELRPFALLRVVTSDRRPAGSSR